MSDPSTGRFHGLTKGVAHVDHRAAPLPQEFEVMVADHLQPAAVPGGVVGMSPGGASHVHIAKKGEGTQSEPGQRGEQPMPGLQRLIFASQKVIPLRISAGA